MEQDYTLLANKLYEEGYLVTRVMSDEEANEMHDSIFATISRFPEYKVTDITKPRVLGGFGAYGNPSSFHNPDVRKIRGIAKNEALRVCMPLMSELKEKHPSKFPDVPFYLFGMFDRLCVRHETYGNVTKEDWHRDTYSSTKYASQGEKMKPMGESDLMLGGWVNLNSTKQEMKHQYFNCVPGTHTDIFNSSRKRKQNDDAEVDGEGFQREDADLVHYYNENKKRILVPPGHMIMFFQGLIHEVAPNAKSKEFNTRLFVGHHISKNDSGLYYPQIANWILYQGVPRLPSGQWPPMYSINHYAQVGKTPKKSILAASLQDWGNDVFHDVVLNQRVTNGIQYKVPGENRIMSSLRDYKLPMYRSYTEEEAKVLGPEIL